MDEPEIEQMALLEREHWWYRGLRHAIERTLRLPRLQLLPEPAVLDAGCGTGQNLRLLQDVLSPAYAGGFDISPHAVEWTRRKVGESADVYVSDIRDPQIHVEQLDLVLSCDVITIPGIAESKPGLRKLVDRLCVGGLFIHNMAAFRWMYSSHDVITRTRDRATVADMRKLFEELGLAIELMTYRVFTLFPALVLARLPSIVRNPTLGQAHSDLRPVTPWLNGPLASILRFENWAMEKGLRFPWGSSVFTVGRKR